LCSFEVKTNPLLDASIYRSVMTPDALFGAYHDGTAWTTVTVQQFIERARRFATYYRENEIRPGDIVFLVVQRPADAHAAFLGAMLAGAIPSFLPYPNVKQDSDAYWKQHRKVFESCGARAILVYDEIVSSATECVRGIDIMILRLTQARTVEPLADLELPGMKSVALLQHSSGTTGLKKGVMLSYESILLQLDSYSASLALTNSAKEFIFASWLPLYHDMGLVSSFLLPLYLGIPIVSIDPFVWVVEPSLLFDGIERYRATHAWIPNFAFLHIARRTRPKDDWDLSSIVSLINCSEPCKPESFDEFLRRFEKFGIRADSLQTCYAMAETVFAVSQSQIDRPVRRIEIDQACIAALGHVSPVSDPSQSVVLMSNGPAIEGCSVAIWRNGALVGEREIGELLVNAKFMFSGYHNNLEATRSAFLDEWYKTGDLGFVDQGEIFIVGRIKDLVIINGKNIFAHDVEAVVSRVPGVKPGRAVAFGYFADNLGSEQLIVVAERMDGRAAAHIMRDINHAVIGEVGIPCSDVRIVAQGWLTKTTSGKISRSENSKKYLDTFCPRSR